MTQNPDALRADIEETRRRLSTNVDAVADKVTPSHIVNRRVDKIKSAVFGARDDVSDRAGNAAHHAQDAVSGAVSDIGDAPQVITRKAQGSPIAAGLIAFGAGLLVSSLFPASEKEREAAQAVKEAAQPLTDELSHAAQEVAEHLREPAQDAMQNVKDSATEAAANVKDEGQAAAADVQDRAHTAKDNVSNQ
ncbi:gas vesicle protein [Arthrobacter bambusae]|uniref:Gas vesicle protein n=1 Tax=Arthrobacter bambusae TaxID=1338426 RepID=A0ABV2PCY2_9MICC